MDSYSRLLPPSRSVILQLFTKKVDVQQVEKTQHIIQGLTPHSLWYHVSANDTGTQPWDVCVNFNPRAKASQGHAEPPRERSARGSGCGRTLGADPRFWDVQTVVVQYYTGPLS